MSGVSSLSSFQSTHPHGVRRLTQVMSLITLMFQSTHPHGVRRSIFMGMYRPRPGFNPRTHTGCDLSLISHYSHHLSFNPRTHTGCDYPDRIRRSYYLSFNPRTHTGCDFTIITTFIEYAVSIHAPTRGATQLPFIG